MQELIMEAADAFKIYYDGRTDDRHCFRWTIYTGTLLADCKVGDIGCRRAWRQPISRQNMGT